MNFSVIRGADTAWGRSFANALATSNRHLILTGSDKTALETLANFIVNKYLVQVHYCVTNDSDTESIISTCEYINDRFKVDLLINYAEFGFYQRLEDYDIRSLDIKLKSTHTSGMLYFHQLLPNLLLHGHAQVIHFWCSHYPIATWQQALLNYHERFAEHLSNEMLESGVKISSFSLPASDRTKIEMKIADILESVAAY